MSRNNIDISDILENQKLFMHYNTIKNNKAETKKDLEEISKLYNDLRYDSIYFNKKYRNITFNELKMMSIRLLEHAVKVDYRKIYIHDSYIEAVDEMQLEMDKRNFYLSEITKLITQKIRLYEENRRKRIDAIKADNKKRAMLRRGANL